MQKSYLLNKSNKQHQFLCHFCKLPNCLRYWSEASSHQCSVFSSMDFATLCAHHLSPCFWYRHWVSICKVPLQQIAGLTRLLPPCLSDPALACADEPRVDTLMSGVCACACECRRNCGELHLLCKCEPLIDCRARSLSFTGWTLPSAVSRGSCQGNVCPTHTHTCTHAYSQTPSLSLSSSVRAGLAQGQSEDGRSVARSVLFFSVCLGVELP